MGLDGFAINIGDPTGDWVATNLQNLFTYAASSYSGKFCLFISMDFYALKNAGKKISDYSTHFNNYLGNDAWCKDAGSGKPMVSTFSDGGLLNTDFTSWQSTLPKSIYFIPDFDGTQGYYSAADGWWSYWGDVVDGLFSWESAWPEIGSTTPQGDVSQDVTVMKGATSHSKGYMIAVSALQYKDSYNTNEYRPGSLNLPNRMANVLAMSPQPEYAEIITWNDAPESHYIGDAWPEANQDAQPSLYTNSSHKGWAPLIRSFAEAFRSGGSAASMAPQLADATASYKAVGSLWYKTIFQDTTCSGTGQYQVKPAGFDMSNDSADWAVVVAAGQTGLQARFLSNGVAINTTNLVPGLNKGETPSMTAGDQEMQVLDASGTVLYATTAGRCPSHDCVDGIYNMNPQVVELVPAANARTSQC